MQKKQTTIIPPSTIIKNRYRVTQKIGQGSFGETYAAVDITTNESVAIKVERIDDKKMVLKQEVIAIKSLQLLACPYVVHYINSGRQDYFNFLVMERLGENLAELRKNRPTQVFSMCTSLRLGIQMIESLEGIHKLGYIHRDVKPSNFVMGHKSDPRKRRRAYLIDFGLARKFRSDTGEIRPPRKNAGFRGTARYASIASHYKRELGRVDDLWSVLYAVIEFLKGHLPWMKMKEKDMIGQVKERETNPNLCKDLPSEFVVFMEHLQKLEYADEPDYNLLKGLLLQIYVREGYNDEIPYDWQQVAAASPIPQQTHVSTDDVPNATSQRNTSTMENFSSSMRNSNASMTQLGRNNSDVKPSRHSLPANYNRAGTQVAEEVVPPVKPRDKKAKNCKSCTIM
ncbi:serine/threonine-protein kinase [Acrasis kona]|uniref:non-specific serine/threonine protein kinase n=1 Tax=Acrasis kona TaxID=1008807 RepID=A0AAW2ZKS4_9EUKA